MRANMFLRSSLLILANTRLLALYCDALHSCPVSTIDSFSCKSLIGSPGFLRYDKQSTGERRLGNRLGNFLHARGVGRAYMGDEDIHDELSRQQRLSTDRPTQTRTDAPLPPVVPSKPVIVVLGASGKIGRLVVRQLLEIPSLDATIVAFCRDYDKACRVLYDDMIVARHQKKGPNLQIVQGDLVPPDDLPGYLPDEDEEKSWRSRAASAAAFYGKTVEDFDNLNATDRFSDEALEDAIRSCTAIISCVGAVRPTNVWTDFISRPLLRLLRKDVSGWCRDPRHPFYVHYMSTKKTLRLAEKEQRKREAAASLDEENESKEKVPRIRFIRISDLVCSQQPWNFVPLVTNIIRSMVFRYHEMAEQILEASPLIDTITLRPGDLVDDIRDEDTTSIQLDPSGSLRFPSRIGRDDVASLAVSAALFDFSNEKSTESTHTNIESQGDKQPIHYTLACRWASENLEPYPAQGRKSDGHPNANACFNAVYQTLKQPKSRNGSYLNSTGAHSILAAAQRIKITKRKMKPYGICVAIPVYIMIALVGRTLLRLTIPYIPATPFWITVASRINELFATAIALLAEQEALLHLLLAPLWNLIPGRSVPKYIPF